jgi:hypothetical protein
MIDDQYRCHWPLCFERFYDTCGSCNEYACTKHLFSCCITGELLCGACYKTGSADNAKSLWELNGEIEQDDDEITASQSVSQIDKTTEVVSIATDVSIATSTSTTKNTQIGIAEKAGRCKRILCIPKGSNTKTQTLFFQCQFCSKKYKDGKAFEVDGHD